LDADDLSNLFVLSTLLSKANRLVSKLLLGVCTKFTSIYFFHVHCIAHLESIFEYFMAGLILLTVLLISVSSLFAFGTGEREEASKNPVVTAPKGTYIGRYNNGIAEFLGIRYAAPIERWKPPKDVTSTSKNVIEAREWGPSCVQPYHHLEKASQLPLDEDCLTVNIWTKDLNIEKKPVMVFIHGGSYVWGGTNDPLYDGEYFVRNLDNNEDVVMVTINYRLGMFGCLDLSVLEGYTEEYRESLGLWLLDQEQALKWIHENIGAFGGDPGNVTIFGQSAGGMSVIYLMTEPEVKGLFHKAIVESGAHFFGLTTRELKAEASRNAFKIMGVSSLKEFLAVTPEELRNKYLDKISETVDFGPRVADGVVLSEDFWQRLKDGYASDIPLIIGATNGEMDQVAIDQEDMEHFPAKTTDPGRILSMIKSHYEAIGLPQYAFSPLSNPHVIDEYLAAGDDPVKRMCDLFVDLSMAQGSIYTAEAQSEWNAHTYPYSWCWAPDVDYLVETMGNKALPSLFGRAQHCMDLYFVLGTYGRGYTELSGPAEGIPLSLVRHAIKTWYAFAKTGDPNNDLIPAWKPYNEDSRMAMLINKKWRLESDPRKEDRVILNQIRPLGER
jgi:para-nitrobenzyl esterase